MAATPSFFGILLMLFAGGGLGPMLGLPPGERDEALLRVPPAKPIIYTEWAARGHGKKGAQGIEGLLGDHEVEEFLEKLQTAILDSIQEETQNGSPTQQTVGAVLPNLLLTLSGRPGCYYVSYDEENVLTGDTPQDVVVSFIHGLRAGLVINGGKQADEISADLLKLLQLLPNGEGVETIDRFEFVLPLPGIPVVLHRQGEHFILAVGDGVLDDVISGLGGKSNGFAENERFQAGMKKVLFERTGNLGWFDAKGVLGTVTAVLEPAGIDVPGVAQMLGLDGLDYVVSASGIAGDGQLTQRQFIATDGKHNGILKLATGRGITPGDLTQVPADADFVLSLSLNGTDILDELRKILAVAGPGPVQVLEESLIRIEEQTGLSVENDLLSSLDDVWTIHNSPNNGGLLFSGVVLTVGVKEDDVQKAREVFGKAMAVLEQKLPGVQNMGHRIRGVELKQGAFLARSIYYVNTVGDDDVPIAPAFCLAKDRLYVALHPQSIKAQLRSDAVEDEKTFADRWDQDVKPPEGDLICLAYCDAQKIVKLLYAAVPYLGQAILSDVQANTPSQLDSFDLPSARAILPYIGPYSSTTVRTPEGIMTTTKSALPLPIGLGTGTLLPAVIARPVRVQAQPAILNEVQEAPN